MRRALAALVLAAGLAGGAAGCEWGTADPGGCGPQQARDGDGRDRNTCEPDRDNDGIGDDDQ